MIQQIIDASKHELNEQLQQRGLSESQSKEAIGMAKEIIQGKLISQLSDATGLVTLLGKSQALATSTVVKNMMRDFAIKMIIKFGCSDLTAKGVANYAIPLLMRKIGNQVSEKGLNGNSLSKQLQGSSLKFFGKGILNFF